MTQLNLILLLLILVLLFGGGGFYMGAPYHYYGGGVSLLVVVLIVFLLLRSRCAGSRSVARFATERRPALIPRLVRPQFRRRFLRE